MTGKQTSLIAAGIAVTLALGACGSGGGGSGSGNTIKIGAISSLTGPLQFPETRQAAKAVFDDVNAHGGIDGKKIRYLVEDDKGTPAVAAQAARRLVDQQGVVGLVGGTSLASCAVNARYYEQKDILSVEGAGVLSQCFTSSNISPVNTGPFSGYTSLLYWASEVRKRQRVCAILVNVPGLNDGYLAAIERWKKLTGKQLAGFDNSLGISDDPTPAVAKMKRARCDAVIFNANEPQVLPVVNAARKQGFYKGVDWVTLTSAYTVAVAKAVAKAGGAGLFANSEYEPYTSTSGTIARWRALMEAHHVPLTSFAEGGYLSALIAVQALKSIKGEVTRESFTKALHAITDYGNPLIGSPYSFAPADAHNPNQSSKFVEVTADGGWKLAEPNWLRLPTG
jgi:branched-chain amino acid transport system substrate-binding protein